MTPEDFRTATTHREKLLHGLHLSTSIGVEIGALCRPCVRKEDGSVIYVDHADTAALRAKYAGDPNVNLDALVEVGGVWGSNTLQDAIGGRFVDYVVASHVVEHVPDLIAWLQELASILRPTGEVRLAVPDGRFTFDMRRRVTQLQDVLVSYIARARVPQPHSMLDFALSVVHPSPNSFWNQDARESANTIYTLDQALTLARDILLNGNYHDIHCWVFTPSSFAELMHAIARAGLTDLACDGFYDTSAGEAEFFVRLRRSAYPEYIAESWQRMARHAYEIPLSAPVDRWRSLFSGFRGFWSERAPSEHDERDARQALGVPSTFDAEQYLRVNEDVRRAGEDAITHFRHHGWREGRAPAA
ncbi:methyltransferase domain-containing protein [Paraburkholderia tropica]|uniref:methyltransferase domain-containing protein n=1 Tax=Paraburkholderia tropica TaxID=92647 RepID=UPI002AB7D4BC|nr:methyltransferase domain-containing protein [Paraburkholderia tropica]